MAIAQYTALFSLLGTTYGGDGKNTFKLPDLRSRTPLHRATNIPLGQTGGVETVTLDQTTMAGHNHQWIATTTAAAHPGPNARILAEAEVNIYAPPNNLVAMAAQSLQPAGEGMAHANVQPSLGVNVCIALEGVFPSRN